MIRVGRIGIILWKKINLRYSEICKVLNILQNDSDEKSWTLSTGLLKEISSYNIILVFCIKENFLEVKHCPSCELHNSSLLLPVAINLIKCTKTNLLKMCCHDFWITIEKLAYYKAIKNRIEGLSDKLRSHSIKHFNKKLDEYYVTTTAGQNNSLNKISIKAEEFYSD